VPPSGSLAAAKDADLVRAVGQGQEPALAELYDRYAPLLAGLAQRILARREDAEEVVQEVFTHLWRQAASYDPTRSSVSTWLVLIARSRAIDRLRSGRARERALEAAQGEDPPLHTSPQGAGAVLSSERRRRVRDELERLPPEQREVLAMAFYGGMTQSEIAAATGIPLGTVKTRTLLAMKKLRAALRDEVRELL
jgi:RNA polymerase sigma-70 factor (ECF subfamily)